MGVNVCMGECIGICVCVLLRISVGICLSVCWPCSNCATTFALIKDLGVKSSPFGGNEAWPALLAGNEEAPPTPTPTPTPPLPSLPALHLAQNTLRTVCSALKFKSTLATQRQRRRRQTCSGNRFPFTETLVGIAGDNK